ncbi:hypothetical protein PYW07_004571 [Mythimna separata]|uniref:Tripartite motif-containing protein 2-like n=1 Tax=Mythimna separata TaxID=271217 RepID=A0AAD7YYJ3_MYTSE|nr:hypothetical protein PYW07_004571 [Mythimna separata]
MYCCSFLSRLGVGMASMSSTLVETVSINYEDFNESFLTCGTCLCTYDGGEHTPKLLPCSHTVCLHCLTRIAASQTRDAGSFRCPICRELITIPRGGVAALPPSFLVNQLLDLMARQRREVIPQCSSHPGRELLFCETCDCVFCRHCADGPHSDTPCDHTVVPFSIALKRMSEILLYRANECLSKLGSARDAVASELRRLEAAATAADEAIDRHFAELKAAIDKRHSELKSAAAAAATHKRKLLEEQLKLIDAEKAKVEAECSGLQQQVEVREVSSRAAALGARLGDAAALAEPRENAFLAVDFAHNDAQQRFAEALAELGRVRTSTTFPGLCTLQLESACVCGLEVVVVLRTVDYHGEARCTGGDPVSAAATIDDAPLPCTVTDLDTGLYRFVLYCHTPHGGLPRRGALHGRRPRQCCCDHRRRAAALHRHRPRHWPLQVCTLLSYSARWTTTARRAARAATPSVLLRPSTTRRCLAPSPTSTLASTGLYSTVILRTVDYHGEARCTGGDPVSAAATIDDAPLPCTVTDLDTGLYRITMRPWSAGALCVRVLVFARGVRDSPLRAQIAATAPPLLVWGSRGTGKEQLSQPVALARCPKRREIYVLDAGNSRVKVLDDETFAFKTHIVNEGLAGRSCTGIAVTAEGIVAVNWRTRTLTEVTADGTTLRTIRSERLVEPVCVAADTVTRRLAVADNGARAVFLFDRHGNIEREVGNGELGLVGGLALSEDLLIIADVAVRVYDTEGNLKNVFAPVPKGRGGYGGVALECDAAGAWRVVCARAVRGRPALLVLDARAGKVLAAAELAERRPRRVAGLALLPDRRALLADLAADCLRLHTYW